MTTIQNHDTGSLKVGTYDVAVGQQIQIEGEKGPRTITYVAKGATPERTCVYFKRQGPVPMGTVSFTILPSLS